MRAKFINKGGYSFTEDSDPIEDMGIGIEVQMRKKLEKLTISEFIDFIDDNFPEIREKYRDEDAMYDDAWYKDIPLSELEQYGIKEYMLDKIDDNTEDYEGWLHIDYNQVSMGCGA